MRILIIEDDQPIASFVKKGLVQEGFTVDHTTDGEEGLYMCLDREYAAAVVDIMLPSMNGFSIIEELRKKGNQTPIIILSAKQTVDDRIKGFQKGGDDYLVKPFLFMSFLSG